MKVPKPNGSEVISLYEAIYPGITNLVAKVRDFLKMEPLEKYYQMKP